MEEWKTVVVNGEVYNNYMVSNWGNVKSLNYRNTGKEKMLKLGENAGNYLIVALYKDGKQKTCLIHRLVAEAFLPKAEEKTHVDHIDSDRQNNNVNNLRWCSQAENNQFDLFRKHMSEARKGEKHHMYGKHHTEEARHKMREAHNKQVLCLELNKIFGSATEAGMELGIDQSSISKCCLGKLKSSGKHPVTGEKLHWKYVN